MKDSYITVSEAIKECEMACVEFEKSDRLDYPYLEAAKRILDTIYVWVDN